MTENAPEALIVDFGGVLTSNLCEAFRDFSLREGLPENSLIDLVTGDSEGSESLRRLEKGQIGQIEFEAMVARRLGVPGDGLLSRMAAGLRPDEAMLAHVAELRQHGLKVAILSNSWGSGYFDPYAPWDLESRADVVILSDRVRMRKPEPEIYELAAGKIDVSASACVFVDDIAAYLPVAKSLGMTTVHHTGADSTITRLSRIFASHLDMQA